MRKSLACSLRLPNPSIPGAVIAQADELRECLRFLEAAGVPAVDAFGDLTSQCATDLDETAARMAELQENLMAAARRVAAGQGVTG